MKNGIVFAPLVRVSTEKQAKKGESLETQRKQLQSAIDGLGGTIYKWYAGHEHATPDQERKILDELMKDAAIGKFHAIMVVDTSRWSRDNKKSKECLEILKENGIRFYLLQQEMDLKNPHDILILGMGAEINEFFAQEQSRKSIINRIERAKKGFPSCGKLPYGRKFSEETGWVWKTDPKKQKIIEEAARLYLEDDGSFEELGKKFGMNPSSLCKILKKRCGSEWEIRFKNKKFGIDEIVKIEIPPLLPESVIRQIREKCEARRTWDHKSQKYDYLFSRIIYDADSRYALTGTPNVLGKRYYRTYKKCPSTYMINADIIEEVFLEEFFQTLGNDHALLKAVFDGKSVDEIVEGLRKKKKTLETELDTIKREMSKAIQAIRKFEGENMELFLENLKSNIKGMELEISKKEFEIQVIDNQLKAMPTKSEINKEREIAQELMRVKLRKNAQRHIFRDGDLFSKLPFKEKQKLIKLIFGGKDHNGKRYGIYVRREIKNKQRVYRFEAYGRLGNFDGWIYQKDKEHSCYSPYVTNQLEQKTIDEVSSLIKTTEPKFFDQYYEACNKEHALSQCHAHHSFRFHQR